MEMGRSTNRKLMARAALKILGGTALTARSVEYEVTMWACFVVSSDVNDSRPAHAAVLLLHSYSGFKVFSALHGVPKAGVSAG